MNYRVTSRRSASQSTTQYAIIVAHNDGVFRQEFHLADDNEVGEARAVEFFLTKIAEEIDSAGLISPTPADMLDERTAQWIDEQGYERREDLETTER